MESEEKGRGKKRRKGPQLQGTPAKAKARLSESCSVMSDSLRPHGQESMEFFRPGSSHPSSWGSSQPRDGTQVSRIADEFLTTCANREAQGQSFFFSFKFIYFN